MHPLDNLRKVFWQKIFPICDITAKIVGKRIRTAGIISKIKKIITKNGKQMLFVNIEDQVGNIEMVTFPSVIAKNPNVFQENKLVIVQGRIDARDGTPKLICENVEEIIENS